MLVKNMMLSWIRHIRQAWLMMRLRQQQLPRSTFTASKYNPIVSLPFSKKLGFLYILLF